MDYHYQKFINSIEVYYEDENKQRHCCENITELPGVSQSTIGKFISAKNKEFDSLAKQIEEEMKENANCTAVNMEIVKTKYRVYY